MFLWLVEETGMRKHSLNLECEAVDLFHDLGSALHLLTLEAQETLNLELVVQTRLTHMMAHIGSKPRSVSSKLYLLSIVELG